MTEMEEITMKKFVTNMLIAAIAIVLYALLWEKVNYPNESAFEVLGYVFEAENINVFFEMAGSVAAMQWIVEAVARLRARNTVKEEENHMPLEHATFMTVDQVRQMPKPARPIKKPQPKAVEEV